MTCRNCMRLQAILLVDHNNCLHACYAWGDLCFKPQHKSGGELMQPWSVDIFRLPEDSTDSYVEGTFTESRALALLKGLACLMKH